MLAFLLVNVVMIMDAESGSISINEYFSVYLIPEYVFIYSLSHEFITLGLEANAFSPS